MKDPVFRDTLIALCILGVVSAVFLFGVYLPGHSRMEAIEMQTAAAEQSLRDIPIRVAELEMLDADLRERQDYLKKSVNLVPSVPDTHGTIRDVAELAHSCSLKVARLEPLSPVRFETLEALPYRLSLEGPFLKVVVFLHGLENRSRLFWIENLTISRDSRGQGESTLVEINFSTFVARTETTDRDEIDASPDERIADTRKE